MLKNKKGFTLIELLIVVAILGILAAIIIPQATGHKTGKKYGQNNSNTECVCPQEYYEPQHYK